MTLEELLKPFIDRPFNQSEIEKALLGYFQDRLISVNYLLSNQRRVLEINIEAYQEGTPTYNGLYSYNSTINYA